MIVCRFSLKLPIDLLSVGWRNTAGGDDLFREGFHAYALCILA